MKNLYKFSLFSIGIIFFNLNIYSQVSEGIYTIGTGQTYNNFTEAVSDIAPNITGNLTFEVIAGTYNEQIILPFLDNQTNFLITFKKKAGETGEILLNYNPTASNNYILQIEGSFYRFNNINFQNSSNDVNVGNVVSFNNSQNNIDDVIFENCNFLGRLDLSTEQYSDPGNSVIISSDDNYTNNIKFINDTISGGSYSIYINNSAISSHHITISGCEIKDFYNTGIYMTEVSEYTIINNTISDKFNISNTPATGIFSSSPYWYSFEISSNKIDLQRDNTKTCINLTDVWETPDAGEEYNVKNNMLITRNASNSYISTGINLVNSSFIQFYYNSIHIQDGNTESSAINISDINSSNLTLQNNLLINTGNGFGMLTDNIEQGINSDFNDYYTNSNLVIKDNSQEFDLQNWQNYTFQDLNSFSAMPHFVSESDLHISNGFAYVESRATPITETLDIDGNTRNLLTPDIGADEGDFKPLWAGDIFSEVIWEGTINVGTDIFISEFGNLTIMPGTKINFIDHYSIICDGIIDATGEPESEILFTASNKDIGWGGITHNYSMIQAKNYADYQYCKFEYAKNPEENGGVFKLFSDMIMIQNSKFYNNSALNGGAIYTEMCMPNINANLFFKNSATINGGAISTEMMEIMLTNNIFTGNTTTGNGGAVSISNTSVSPISFINNTFYNNSATGFGEDLYLYSTSVEIYNSFFWNTAPTSELIYEEFGTGNNLNNCIITGNESGTNIGMEKFPQIIPCNDPKFTDPAKLNFSVQANSDAVNNGYNGEFPMSSDYAGNPRIYDNIDIGAFEFQAPKLIADAGISDLFCGKTYTTNALNPSPYTGTWSIIDKPVEITDIHSNSTLIANIKSGVTNLKWTVTNGIVTETDTLTLINDLPIANAGKDIFMLENDININIFPDTFLNANLPSGGEVGYWTQLSGTPLTVVNNSLNTTLIQNIAYGQSLLRWTVDNGNCANTDDLFITAGHSFVSAPDDGILDWDNPNDWDVNGVPGFADSVTIFGCTANINNPGAKCDRLNIGNGGNVFIAGTVKAETGFTGRTIFIEQNAEKFPNVKGTANLNINNGATINIGAGYITKDLSTENSGLFIGGGGTVFIEQNAEKDIKGNGNMNIGSGGVVFIEQNAEKGVGAAEMRIGTGGFVFIEQNAEKDILTKNVAGGDLYIGSGGFVFIEQNAEKAEGGYLGLGAGRTIFIEQNAEKDQTTGGHFGIYGGTVFIEQNAEKNTKESNSSSIYCGRGGTIFIEQNAEKLLSNANLIAPSLKINGGIVRIGNNVKSKSSTGNVQFRQVFIEQNAEKGFANDTALIVYPSGGLFLSDSTYYGDAEIVIEKGEAVTFYEGSSIKLSNIIGEEAQIILKEGSSLIDMNTDSKLNGLSEHVFPGDISRLYSPSLEGIFADQFSLKTTVSSWTEPNATWNKLNGADMLISGMGYAVKSEWYDDFKTFEGDINTGTFNIPVSSDNMDNFEFQGWNLIGNPYPSAIDIESIIFSSDINSNVYTYNPKNKSYDVFQKGGVFINDAVQYISPNQAFFVKADANTTFDVDNTSRIHFFEVSASKDVNNILKLKVTGNGLYDETAILFKPEASNGFDTEFDAVKFSALTVGSPLLYTNITDENLPLAINTLKYETSSPVVPLHFESGTSGDYIINVNQLLLDEGISVSLKDLKTGNQNDLATNPTYAFTYSADDDSERFELIFNGLVEIQDIKSEQNLNIYSNGSTIFINSAFENLNVEVYNLNGQMLYNTNFTNSGLNTITLNLPNSLYLIKAKGNGKSFTKKVVISK